ncbi:nitroreductase/quinone reductase family protein [Nocardia sp. CDC153]|uniref:nitroreductase/quinone reductase family protein n=1 Tax=Nocardia sp. CDC153 TaxID=3112167 RepID=UPI002DB94A57|nr:nitroreductase/quinone reductase family protein [Nocardia sp. CDC153]MEC3957752.1 nitroreductase/quinone reductase family protein [Nocardia sp. CDC153]
MTNPAVRYLTARIPGYANVVHIGRRSGRRFRTPVGTTWRGDELRIAVNYGERSDWVRNILKSGAFELEHRGDHLRMTDPHLTTIDGRPTLVATVAH